MTSFTPDEIKQRKHRDLQQMIAYYAISLVLLVGMAAILYRLSQSYEPFGEFPVPQKIVGAKEVRPGGVLKVRATKCYRGDKLIPIIGVSVFVRSGPSRLTVPYTFGAAARDPQGGDNGCYTSTYHNRIPADLPAGRWRIEGSDTARQGSDSKEQGWYTETFTVLPKEIANP